MPILMTEESVAAIEVLIESRAKVGVNDANLYVFAAPTRGSKNPLRGYQCISNVVSRIPDLVKGQLIKSTKLRKYVATVAQVVHLKHNELEWLANHLGKC